MRILGRLSPPRAAPASRLAARMDDRGGGAGGLERARRSAVDELRVACSAWSGGEVGDFEDPQPEEPFSPPGSWSRA